MGSERERLKVTNEEGYNRWSAAYDTEDNPLVALDEFAFVPQLPDVRGKRVLELGCGTGRVTARLSHAANIVALDVSQGMLDVAKTRLDPHNLELKKVNLDGDWRLATEPVDCLISALVIEHIQDLHSFFAQAYREAAPRAVFVFSAMHPAMFLIQKQAHFVDAAGVEVRFDSYAHQVSDMVNAAMAAGWEFEQLNELVVNESHLRLSAKLAKFVGWPMWLSMRLSKHA